MGPESMDWQGADETAAQAQFLSSVFDRYGYDLREYAPASLRRRIHAALGKSGLSTMAELEARSLADPAFFTEVLENLTVRVSGMFRNPSFYRALWAQVFPRLVASSRLNIWHGGCATGEEAYSTAILLSEAGLYDRCQIYATDRVPSLWRSRSWESFPRNTSGDHGGLSGGRGKVRALALRHARLRPHFDYESLRRNIHFFQHDLVGDHVFDEMDLILCRNVMIYFGRELQARVVAKLGDSLRTGGFLRLGRSEQLSLGARAQFSELAAAERIYQKAAPG